MRMKYSLTVVICGTPGTGKSRLLEELKKTFPKFKTINLSRFAIENDCISGFDNALDTHEIDEDKLLEKLERLFRDSKFNIIECIHADMLPIELVDWVYVCRADNTKLYDRLKERNYNESKIDNNIQAEIFQTILDEAAEYFDQAILTQLWNNEESDLEKNCKIVEENVRRLLNDL